MSTPMLINSLPSSAVLGAHLLQWFGPNSPHSQRSGVNYDSSDPVLIARQIRLAQRFNVQVFWADWYGPQAVNPNGDLAFRNLLMVCNVLNTGFRAGICIDKGALKAIIATGVSAQQAFQTCYNYVKQTYATNPAFFSPFIMEFGCAKAASELSQSLDFSAFPDVIHDDSSIGRFYTWALPNAVSIAQHYSSPNCVMGSICAHFDDGDPTNRNVQIWNNSLPVRLMDAFYTGANWTQSFTLIPLTMKYIQLVTWNDYEEHTALEGLFQMFQ